MNWYVIMAYSGYELKVKAAIEENRAILKDAKKEVRREYYRDDN